MDSSEDSLELPEDFTLLDDEDEAFDTVASLTILPLSFFNSDDFLPLVQSSAE